MAQSKGTGNLKLDHATSFTVREIKTLVGWYVAAEAGAQGAAGRVLSTGLLAEHYESLLPEDPNDRTAEEVTILNALRIEADAALATLGAMMPSLPGVPYRDPTDERGGQER